MTQRQWPRMALIRTAIGDGALRVSAPGHGRPADRAGRFRPGSGQRNRHRLEGQPARAARAAAGRWFSDFLGTPCRLYKVDPAARRPAKTDWVSRWLDAHPDESERFSGTHHFGFADGFPLLVANQASLDDLNARLREGRGRGADGPVPAQYRGAGDWEAFEEDHTALIEAAECAWLSSSPAPAARFGHRPAQRAAVRRAGPHAGVLPQPGDRRGVRPERHPGRAGAGAPEGWRRGADRTGFLGPADMAAGGQDRIGVRPTTASGRPAPARSVPR